MPFRRKFEVDWTRVRGARRRPIRRLLLARLAAMSPAALAIPIHFFEPGLLVRIKELRHPLMGFADDITDLLHRAAVELLDFVGRVADDGLDLLDLIRPE